MFHKHIQYFTTINIHEGQSRAAEHLEFPVGNVFVYNCMGGSSLFEIIIFEHLGARFKQ